MMNHQFVHCCTKNSPFGNPRRIFVAFNKYGHAIAGWNEGYMGSDCGPENLKPHFYNAPRIDVTVHQYEQFSKLESPNEFEP